MALNASRADLAAAADSHSNQPRTYLPDLDGAKKTLSSCNGAQPQNCFISQSLCKELRLVCRHRRRCAQKKAPNTDFSQCSTVHLGEESLFGEVPCQLSEEFQLACNGKVLP